MLAVEVQSEVRRLEQQLRWQNEKADVLPSAEFWRYLDGTPRMERVLILRSTRANREVASRFAATLATAFPARSADAYAALTTPDAPWPGNALLWATLEGDMTRILEQPPRTVAIGR